MASNISRLCPILSILSLKLLSSFSNLSDSVSSFIGSHARMKNKKENNAKRKRNPNLLKNGNICIIVLCNLSHQK
jgi:hypothetical protein